MNGRRLRQIFPQKENRTKPRRALPIMVLAALTALILSLLGAHTGGLAALAGTENTVLTPPPPRKILDIRPSLLPAG
ncbi:MAG: hypothetical protein LBS10_03720 [Gracilibacteraceae bacterium]|nr:hypothetical protein [Gracilibacteraceae bacterium]